MKPAPAKSRTSSRPISWHTGEQLHSSEPRFISSPTAPATRKCGPWTRTDRIKSRSLHLNRSPSCPLLRPTDRKLLLLALHAEILLYLYSQRRRGGACPSIIRWHR